MKAGWRIVKLGDVCHVYQPETLSQKQLKDGPYPVYGANGKIGFHDEFNHAEPQLTLGCRGTCGVVNWTTENSWINGNAMVVKAVEELVTPQFLSYALRGGINIGDSISGTAQPQITRKSLTPIEIPLPPLAEQKRIVALLDEAFARIDEAKTKAEANLEKAKSVFESYLECTFEKYSKSCGERPLEDVLVKSETVDPTRSPNVEFDYIDVSSVSKETLSIQETQKLLGKDAPSRARKAVKTNDVIFATIRPTLRRIAIVPEELNDQVCSTGYIVLRTKADFDHRWVFYFLQTRSFMVAMEALQKGASYPAVTDNDVRSQAIPAAALKDQSTATDNLDKLRSEISQLTLLYNNKISLLIELQESLLAQAFAGELTA